MQRGRAGPAGTPFKNNSAFLQRNASMSPNTLAGAAKGGRSSAFGDVMVLHPENSYLAGRGRNSSMEMKMGKRDKCAKKGTDLQEMLKGAPKQMNKLEMYCPGAKLPKKHVLLKLTDLFEKKKEPLKDGPPQVDDMGRPVKNTDYRGFAKNFNLKKSLFKHYAPEEPNEDRTKMITWKALQKDIENSEIESFVNKKDMDSLVQRLWEHFDKIKDIFKWEIGTANKPYLTIKHFRKLTRDYKMIKTNVDKAVIGWRYDHQWPGKTRLSRCDYIELIVRISMFEQNENTDLPRTPGEATQLVLYYNVFANAKWTEGFRFRHRHVFHNKMDEIFYRNLSVIEQIYLHPNSPIKTSATKKYITLKECKQYLKAMKWDTIAKEDVGIFFFESCLTVEDTVHTKRLKQMQPWEFLVFMCRVTQDICEFNKPELKSASMDVKMETLLQTWLDPIGLKPIKKGEEEEQKTEEKKE